MPKIIKKEEDSDDELLEHVEGFGFTFTKEKNSSGEEIFKSQTQQIKIINRRPRKGKPVMKRADESLNEFISNKKQKVDEMKEPVPNANE